MLATFTILVVLTIVASLIYNAIPSQVTWLRRGLILLVSATVIYAFNPRTLAIAILITAFAFGVYILARRFPARSWIPWLVMAPLVLNAISEVAFDRNWGDLLPFPTGSPVSPLITQLATLGLSFYSFKLYISIKEGLHADGLRVRDMLTGVLFFPSFPIGPIDGAATFNDAAIRRPANPRLWLLGLARIGMGGAKVYLVADWLTNALPVAIGFHSLEPRARAHLHAAEFFAALPQLLGLLGHRDWCRHDVQPAPDREFPLPAPEQLDPKLLAALEPLALSIHYDVPVQASAARDGPPIGLADHRVHAHRSVASRLAGLPLLGRCSRHSARRGAVVAEARRQATADSQQRPAARWNRTDPALCLVRFDDCEHA